MTNNKQHLTDWIFEQIEEMGDLRDCTSLGIIQLNIDKIDYVALKKQAKKMYQNEIEQAKLDAKEIIILKCTEHTNLNKNESK
jgi:AAA+ ATPase superfamily predicted ATPase